MKRATPRPPHPPPSAAELMSGDVRQSIFPFVLSPPYNQLYVNLVEKIKFNHPKLNLEQK